MKPVSIPSKFISNIDMLKSCTGFVKSKTVDITAPQSKRSVNKARVDVRVEQIL